MSTSDLPVTPTSLPVSNLEQTCTRAQDWTGLMRSAGHGLVCAALVAALSLPASAGDYRSGNARDHAPARAEVIHSAPIYRSVEVALPREVCRDERVEQRPSGRYANSTRRSNTPGIVGAIIGGALGHSVGNGNKNKKIGTAVGAILGGSIGGDISRRNHERSYRNEAPVSYRTERVCYEEIDYRTEQQISGYDVTYVYAGETYNTVLPEAPGRYLDVRVKVTPRSSYRRSS